MSTATAVRSSICPPAVALLAADLIGKRKRSTNHGRPRFAKLCRREHPHDAQDVQDQSQSLLNVHKRNVLSLGIDKHSPMKA